jgi:sRNA-binding carbon storage regulator CsrA
MLLLAHNERETIILETSDGPIEVRLSRLDGAQARIGIDAPRSVRIVRKQLHGQHDSAGAAARTAPQEENWWFHPDDLDGAASLAPQQARVRAGDWDDETLD